MTNTIAGTYATLVTLDTAADNPTTITSTGLLTFGLYVTPVPTNRKTHSIHDPYPAI
jgi:hypothetical protein